MKRVVPLLAGLFLLVGLFATPALADVPPLPHAFYGEVKINDSLADVGTQVEARGPGVTPNIEGNPIEVTVAGKYGGPGGLDPKLVVQGDIEEGTIITFYVRRDGLWHEAKPTAEWHSGGVDEHNLSVTIEAPPTDDDVDVPPPTIETDLFGIEESLPISEEGEIQEEIEATSEDGDVTITIPEGTIALDIEGAPLETLEAAVDESPPDPPEDAHIIGLVYDLGPEGATFDPPLTLEYTYDPDALPEGVAEEDLVIAYYDEEAGEWVELEGCVVDTVNNTISAPVSHFSKYATIGKVVEEVAEVVEPVDEDEEEVITVTPAAFSVSSISVLPAEVEPGETVTIDVAVTNTGGESGTYTLVLKINGVKEADRTVTIDAGNTLNLIFPVTREEAGSYAVTVDGLSDSFTVVVPEEDEVPIKPGTNWPLIGGIIGGVIVVGLLVFFLVVRPRRH